MLLTRRLTISIIDLRTYLAVSLWSMYLPSLFESLANPLTTIHFVDGRIASHAGRTQSHVMGHVPPRALPSSHRSTTSTTAFPHIENVNVTSDVGGVVPPVENLAAARSVPSLVSSNKTMKQLPLTPPTVQDSTGDSSPRLLSVNLTEKSAGELPILRNSKIRGPEEKLRVNA